MSSLRRQRVLLIALAGTWGGALLWPQAHAAPPSARGLSAPLSPAGEERGVSLGGMRAVRGHLDLTPPASLPAGFERPAALGFPAMQRRASAAAGNLPSLVAVAGEAAPRAMSTPERLARNFRREGLPLAKLFQSENSLVHIGLNPKGKPGLWIVEKLH